MLTFTPRFKQMPMALLYIAIFAGYSSVFAETTESKDTAAHHAHARLDWPGVYNGFLPCADCIGVKTSLALNANNTYILITQNVGKSPREFVEKGKFTWGDNNDKIILTPRDSSTPRQYLVGDDKLIELDGNGKRISGKQADSYILRRTDVAAQPPKHQH